MLASYEHRDTKEAAPGWVNGSAPSGTLSVRKAAPALLAVRVQGRPRSKERTQEALDAGPILRSRPIGNGESGPIPTPVVPWRASCGAREKATQG